MSDLTLEFTQIIRAKKTWAVFKEPGDTLERWAMRVPYIGISLVDHMPYFLVPDEIGMFSVPDEDENFIRYEFGRRPALQEGVMSGAPGDDE